MKLTLHSNIIFRVPQFPINADLSSSWSALKESIYLSSPDFYQQILSLDFEDLINSSPEIQHTVWKYFNRAKYRATPYGTFAGLGIMENTGSATGPVTIGAKQKLHRFREWNETTYAGCYGPLDARDLLFQNSSNYIAFGRMRYLIFEDQNFHLSEMEIMEEVTSILALCSRPIPIACILQESSDIPYTLDLLIDMIQHQLLLTSEQPNIIGPEYFKRRGSPAPKGKKAYILAERPYLSGKFPDKLFRHLPELALLLASLNTAKKESALDSFITAFRNRYDMKMVPLLEALDPEFGIGYGVLDLPSDESILPFIGKPSKTSDLSDQIKHAIFKELKSGLKAIDLSDPKLVVDNPILPNTFGMLCSPCNDQLIVDHMGSVTANSLLGRFSLMEGAIYDYCRELAELEQHANPAVLFFDIGYAAEKDVDNVNRRLSIYDHQLSLLTYDTSSEPLLLNDLMLCLRGNSLVLYSRKMKKQLMPRLASAYNYGRSDLAVFRFLSDLQHQGLSSDFHFSISELLPEAAHYPRVCFRNIVISPAKWKLHYSSLALFLGENELIKTKRYLGELGTGQYLVSRTFDRTMLFDIENDADLGSLLFILKKFKSITLEEGFVPKQALINDHAGNPYQSQLMLTLIHRQKIYKQFPLVQQDTTLNVADTYIPGEEWLYYSLYGSQSLSDRLIQKYIAPFLKKHSKDLSCWFFIRYDQNGDHIRLRLRPQTKKHYIKVFSAATALFNNASAIGLIHDVQLCTYKREMERYGFADMEKIEGYFQLDSQYVLDLLMLHLIPDTRTEICFHFILHLLDVYDTNKDVQMVFIDRQNQAFCLEHQLQPIDYSLLNTQFKDFLKKSNKTRIEIYPQWLSLKMKLEQLFTPLTITERTTLFADILHMHINRLFSSSQRTREMQLYYFLSKYLRYRQATV